MVRRLLISLAVILVGVVVIAVAVVPSHWRQIMADYDRDHQPDAVDTIPVHVHIMPGTANEKIIKGSDLIDYRGDVRMIVAEERGQYLIDQISDISTSIAGMKSLGPYCVELLLPRGRYDNTASEVIDKAKDMGLTFCDASSLAAAPLAVAQACPGTELAGIKNHPFTATVTESVGSSSFSYKIARDKDGLLYTYKAQEVGGVKYHSFYIDDPLHNTTKSWQEGNDLTGLLSPYAPSVESQWKLLNLETLPEQKQMEGFDVGGHSFTCTPGLNISMNYHYVVWSSTALASYIDLVEEGPGLRERTHLSEIHLGDIGLVFFKPPSNMKFHLPDPGE
jgi:hypothetical protein